jgi:FkbH-like protein
MTESLNFPFDVNTILRKKKSIKKKLEQKEASTKLNIALLGGSTIDELKYILELFLLKNGIKPAFYQSEYNKFYEDALFEGEKIRDFKPDIIYIHTTNVNILNYPSFKNSHEEIEDLFSKEINKFINIWESLARHNCPIIQNNFDMPINRSLGCLDSYDIHGKTLFINRLNLEFSKYARKIPNLFINDINYLAASIGLQNWFDLKLWHLAKYAVSFDAIPLLANQLAGIINAIIGKSKKCLILDLDNTCWGGVIGDDGLNGIDIGNETAIGQSFIYFQNYVRELKNRGVILAVCSKNEESVAKEGFTHPDSILDVKDFTVFKANWAPKHENILEIAQQINIGLESIIFIDDNSVEREIVSSQLSVVSVPNVGNDVINFIDHIEKNLYFEVVSLLDDDINRNKFYNQNIIREENKALFENYDDFLNSLNMKAEIKTFSALYLERITQLINKTNQFNLTTKRYSIGEIEKIFSDDKYIKIYGKLSDKFGDNGLVSVIIGHLKEGSCQIDLWIMSCRVIKREMEFAMFDELIVECQKKGINFILGNYYKTPKNNMVSDLYQKLGFEKIDRKGDDTIWKLQIKNYVIKNKLIVINDEQRRGIL